MLSFWNPLSDQTAQTRFTTFWYYHVVIRQTICACCRLFAQFRLRRHSPMVFVNRRIYVRVPIRLRRCISAAWTTHPCSLNSLSDVHGIAECLCASSTIIFASCNLRFRAAWSMSSPCAWRIKLGKWSVSRVLARHFKTCVPDSLLGIIWRPRMKNMRTGIRIWQVIIVLWNACRTDSYVRIWDPLFTLQAHKTVW